MKNARSGGGLSEKNGKITSVTRGKDKTCCDGASGLCRSQAPQRD